jgi:hypothetical protein
MSRSHHTQIYSAMRFETRLPGANGEPGPRAGFCLGDGAGVGKVGGRAFMGFGSKMDLA